MNNTKTNILAHGSHGTVYINNDGRTVTKVIHNANAALREIKFLELVKLRSCKNVIMPLTIDRDLNHITFTKMTPLTLLPFNTLDGANKLRIVRQIINGLIEIHSLGIIHNDFKPDNILYDPNALDIKVIDFSTSLWNNERVCISGGTTPLYECPEQTRSYKSDIWSFGICLLQLIGVPGELLKKLKWMNKTTIVAVVRQFLNKNPSHKDHMFMRIALLCLHHDPNKRYLLKI